MSRPPTSTRDRAPAVEAGELSWQLEAPISREVVLPDRRTGRLLVAGGLTGAGTSATGIYALDPKNGRLTFVGQLALPTHDAAGAIVQGKGLLVGGGDTSVSSVTQRFSAPGGSSSARGGSSAPGRGSLAPGALGVPRADAAAATIGATAYVVGGYDGTKLLGEVLATTDGLHFHDVAVLAVPVRYPAVAALDGRIYVFGGLARTGQPVRTVQVVDPGSHKTEVVGRLPLPLSGAAAANLGGTIYVAGGKSVNRVPTASIYAFDPLRRSFLRAGSLRVAVTNAGTSVLGRRLWIVGGETAGGRPTAAVQMLEPNRRFGTAGSPGAGSPFFGDRLLIADRGNNRLLLLNDADQVIWSYPSKTRPAPAGGFYFPDDAFFIRRGTAIISNQEENETLVEIAYPSGRIVWSYGHPRVPGSAPGYLDNPDDAYLLKNGDVTVADPMNCRVLVLSRRKKVLTQIGTDGVCAHDPPHEVGSPNGDTPLLDGNLLISEINGSWIDEYTTRGRLIWAVHLPIGYPSDPQQLGPDRYLVADYEDPGAIVEFNRAGKILYRYQPRSGPGKLNQPSLAEQLPSGVLMLNDDYNDRMVAIDPATGAVVWQYGTTGRPGRAYGLLDTPDGFDLLGPHGSTPTHPATG